MAASMDALEIATATELLGFGRGYTPPRINFTLTYHLTKFFKRFKSAKIRQLILAELVTGDIFSNDRRYYMANFCDEQWITPRYSYSCNLRSSARILEDLKPVIEAHIPKLFGVEERLQNAEQMWPAIRPLEGCFSALPEWLQPWALPGKENPCTHHDCGWIDVGRHAESNKRILGWECGAVRNERLFMQQWYAMTFGPGRQWD